MKTVHHYLTRALLAAAVIALLLCGCGGKAADSEGRRPDSYPQEDVGHADNESDAAPQENGQPSDEPAPDDDRAGDGNGVSESDPDAEDDGQSARDPEEEDDTREPAEPTHYMNENYIFKPIDPEGDRKVVLLTFDDGPKSEETLAPLLAALDKHDAKAIFFVNGFRVEQNPELLKKIYDSGHYVGNHSWDHILLTERTQEEIERQIRDVQEIVRQLTGEAPRFFRPPHGAGNDTVRKVVREEGMLYMTWSNGSLDWDKDNQTPEDVIRNVMEQLHPGSNILMHELPWTAEALDTLLTRLEEEGYAFLDPGRIRTEETPASTAASL
jgi:peptidoglycan/xylan/chitin deacetylase (PgdA/CDA1 family)